MEFGFVNFNQEALGKANKVMKLLQGQGAIDELGLGRIRDAFSNTMFPGMSVLQTRAKYFCLMPALYAFLERTRIADAREARQKVRDLEIRITRRLLAGSNGKGGIIGAESLSQRGSYVKYDPTYVYISGLETYGLVKSGGNLYSILAERSASYTNAPKRATGSDETGDDSDDLNGFGQLFITCGKDYDFRSDAPLSIALDNDEATFLKRQIECHTSGSLLCYLLESDLFKTVTKQYVNFEALGKLLIGNVPDEIYRVYALALCYSKFAQLLRTRYAYLYDIAVGAEKANDELHAFNEQLTDKDTSPEAIGEIIKFVDIIVTDEATKHFCIRAADFIKERNFEGLDKLIVLREQIIKGVRRSKLLNARDFEPGLPFEKAQPMSFRWNTIGFNVLNEISQGLDNG